MFASLTLAHRCHVASLCNSAYSPFPPVGISWSLHPFVTSGHVMPHESRPGPDPSWSSAPNPPAPSVVSLQLRLPGEGSGRLSLPSLCVSSIWCRLMLTSQRDLKAIHSPLSRIWELRCRERLQGEMKCCPFKAVQPIVSGLVTF